MIIPPHDGTGSKTSIQRLGAPVNGASDIFGILPHSRMMKFILKPSLAAVVIQCFLKSTTPVGSSALWFREEDLASSHPRIYVPSLLMNRRAK